MVRWHHTMNGQEFGQTPRDGEGQGSLVRCSPWCGKESDRTERLNELNCALLGHGCCPSSSIFSVVTDVKACLILIIFIE